MWFLPFLTIARGNCSRSKLAQDSRTAQAARSKRRSLFLFFLFSSSSSSTSSLSFLLFSLFLQVRETFSLEMVFKSSLLLLATLSAFSVEASPFGSIPDFQSFNEPSIQPRQHAVYTSGQYTGPYLSETKGGAWSKGYEKASKLVSQMTIEEK